MTRLSIGSSIALRIMVLWFSTLPGAAAQDTGQGNLYGVRHLAFSPNGTLLAACYGGIDQPGTLRIWDWANGTLVLEHHENVGICSASFAPQGDAIAIGVFAKVGKLLNIANGETLAEFHGHESHFRTVAFVNKRLVASGSYDKSIRLWNASDGSQVAVLGEHTKEARTVAVSPDGRYLISGSVSPDCRLWDLKTGSQLAEFSDPDLICPNVAFSRDGHYFLTARWDGKVRIRSTENQKLIAAIQVRSIRGIDLSPDNSLLLACADQPTINAVDARLSGPTAAESAEILSQIKRWDDDDYQVREAASHRIISLGMVALPYLNRVAQFDTPELRIRARRARQRLLQGQSREIDVGHTNNAGVVCFAPDNIHVASGDTGGDVKIWSFADQVVVREFTTTPAVQDHPEP